MYKLIGGGLIMFGLGFVVGMETEKRVLAPRRLSKENKVETEKEEVKVTEENVEKVTEAEVVE